MPDFISSSINNNNLPENYQSSNVPSVTPSITRNIISNPPSVTQDITSLLNQTQPIDIQSQSVDTPINPSLSSSISSLFCIFIITTQLLAFRYGARGWL
jgi:hypothetical protein